MMIISLFSEMTQPYPKEANGQMSWVYWKWFTYLGKWSLMISSDPGGKKPKLLMATSRVVFTTNRRRTITNENNDVIEREIQTENSFACERISTPDPWGGQIKKAPIVQWSQDHTWVDGPTGWGLPCTWGFWIHGQMPILIKISCVLVTETNP